MASGSLVGERDGRDKQSRVYSRKNTNKPENLTSFPQKYHRHKHHQSSWQTLATTSDDNTSSQPKFIPVASDDSSNHNLLQPRGTLNSREPSNGTGITGYVKFDNFVKITFDLRNKDEVRALKSKLASELYQVMSLVKRLEGTQSQSSKIANRNTVRMNSEVGSATNPHSFWGSTVSVNENENNVRVSGELTEKEKAPPKMDKHKKNFDAGVGKETLAPMGSKKKLKSSETGSGHVSQKDLSRLFRSCGNLLEKLMKHKFGWVFNKPVDVKGLGLHDYYTIIKHPMDLGTVKGRLSKKLYKSPKEFAEDVRLTFSNAMLYNPKGQDVHIMAEQLSKIFEEKWRSIEAMCNFGWWLEMGHDSGLPTPTSRETPIPLAPVCNSIPSPPSPIHDPAPATPAYVPFPSPQTVEARTFEKVESMTVPIDPKTKSANLAYQVRTAAAKKPKAKDPDKRDMTLVEKQRLSLSLQELPSEKLDSVVQIIKKRNPVLSQQDDEIEVDIDSFDVDTLWELDRFVTNYKKSLSKNKRKAEFSLQATAQNDDIMNTNMEPVISETPKETEAVEEIISSSLPVREKQGDNVSESSSSSGSGSDSRSSSSDCGHGSDADH